MNEEMKDTIINEQEAADAAVEETIKDAEAAAEPVEDEEIGNIKISVDVVSTIAGIAAAEVKGVAGMYTSFAGGIAEMFSSKKNPNKGVKVEMSEESVTVDLYIVVDYGIRIPELAWEVQENVSANIESMTGLKVDKVNIHIEGVSFEKAQEVPNVKKEEKEEEKPVEETEAEAEPEEEPTEEITD